MSLQNDLVLEAMKLRLAGLKNGLLQLYEQREQTEKLIVNNRAALAELSRIIEPFEKEKKESSPDGTTPGLQ